MLIKPGLCKGQLLLSPPHQCGKQSSLTESNWKSGWWEVGFVLCEVGTIFYVWKMGQLSIWKPMKPLQQWLWSAFREFWGCELAHLTLPLSSLMEKLELWCLQSVWERQGVYNAIVEQLIIQVNCSAF